MKYVYILESLDSEHFSRNISNLLQAVPSPRRAFEHEVTQPDLKIDVNLLLLPDHRIQPIP